MASMQNGREMRATGCEYLWQQRSDEDGEGEREREIVKEVLNIGTGGMLDGGGYTLQTPSKGVQGHRVGENRKEEGGSKNPFPYSDFPGTTASFSACSPFTSNIGSKLLSGCLYDPPTLSAQVKYWP